DAVAALSRLARKAGIPVVMSDNGRGALSDRDPLGFNSLAGRALFHRADVVVVVGSRFIDSMAPKLSWTAPGIQFAYINVDAADLTPPREAAVKVEADAGPALAWLAERVVARTVLSTADAVRVKQWAQQQIDAISPQADYLTEIRNALPEDGIFVNEL